jgi:CBS domain-containing protein
VVTELRDVQDFLARHPPFAALPAPALADVVRHLTIRYLRRGSVFPPADADPAGLYTLRKGAVELRDSAGTLVEKLAEGDSFDGTDCGRGEVPLLSGVAVEDTLVYALGAGSLEALRLEHPAFDVGLERSVAERLRRALDAAPEAPRVGGNLLRLKVADLITRRPVTAPPHLSLREAAALMTHERVSSLLVVVEGSLVGIVTDRDLRSRCIAAGVDAGAPLSAVMTPQPHAIELKASAFEALLVMGRLRIHHLPVADEAGLHGLISTHDLLRAQSTNPLYIADRAGRAASLESLREAVGETRELHLQLVAAHASARQLGQALTSVCDAVTRRLIDLEIERLGKPPVPFAWIATGSQGRGELTLRSDQDNALLLDDRFVPARDGEYFAALTQAVNDGLHSCGYVHCPGGVMACTPDWRQPLQTWRAQFLDWLTRTDHRKVTLAVNFLDMRTVWGGDDLRQRLMAEVLPHCADEDVFQAYLAGHALGNAPPLGFFRNFVLVRSGAHEGRLDLKRHGLLPVVDLARVHAVAGAVEAVATLTRLELAGDRGTLTRDGAESLQAAYEFIWTIRARHQAEQLRAGSPVDNFVDPAALTARERGQLKDAFAAIATLQRALRSAHGDRLPL